MAEVLHVAVLQPVLRCGQPMPNMFAMREQIQALPSGVRVVVLPEMWTGLDRAAETEQRSTEARQYLQTLARGAGVHVVGGSFESRSAGGALQNVAVVVDAAGHIVGEYAKRTLFAREQSSRQAGDAPGVFDIDGVRVGVLICADLWRGELVRELSGRVDLICVPARTAVPSDQHVVYARVLWHNLALVRSMESGIPVLVSDWAAGRHSPRDVDLAVGSVHAPGMEYDRGRLSGGRPAGDRPRQATATAHTSASPALGAGVHFTAGGSSICNPGRRPDIQEIWRRLERGQAGFLCEQLNLADVQKYRDYRRRVGLLMPDAEV